MLRARVVPVYSSGAGGIDLTPSAHYVSPHDGCHHVRLNLSAGAMRLDLVDGGLPPGPGLVEPAIDLRRPLAPQLASITRLDRLCRGANPPVPERRFVHLVEALRTADALAAGASLRAIGLGTLGSEWPGDGEYLKSRVRRRIALGATLLRAGPMVVLSGRI